MSNDLVQRYRELGWVVVEEVFTREEADKISLEAMEISTKELKDAVAGYGADESEAGTQREAA